MTRSSLCSSQVECDQVTVQHTWPLHEKSRQFELGYLLNCAATDVVKPAEVGQLGLHHAGCWECNLTDQSLVWSGGVYDIFGLPRGVIISREEAVAFYSEHSRSTMERLRSYAIRHNRGFTIDVELRPAVGRSRWMRLIGAPVYSGNRPVRLHGVKLII
jgi:PAS domain-containing protein